MILLVVPVSIICYLFYKIGEICQYRKTNKLLRKTYDKSFEEEDIKKRKGWSDCVLYIMKEGDDE